MVLVMISSVFADLFYIQTCSKSFSEPKSHLIYYHLFYQVKRRLGKLRAGGFLEHFTFSNISRFSNLLVFSNIALLRLSWKRRPTLQSEQVGDKFDTKLQLEIIGFE